MEFTTISMEYFTKIACETGCPLYMPPLHVRTHSKEEPNLRNKFATFIMWYKIECFFVVIPFDLMRKHN